MSQQVDSNENTKEASEDLSAKQFYIMQLDANGKLEVGEGATDLLVGVLQNTPESGQAARYRFGGTSKVKIGGNVAIGAFITTNATGKGITTVVDGNVVIGRALEAGVADDIIEVQMAVQHIFVA